MDEYKKKIFLFAWDQVHAESLRNEDENEAEAAKTKPSVQDRISYAGTQQHSIRLENSV